MSKSDNTSSIENANRIPLDDSYEKHYKILSTASHEIMNYAATMGSTYQFIDAKYPETHNFKFWSNLGSSIEHLCSFMKQASICRYCHFPNKEYFPLDDMLGLMYESLDECGYPDIKNCLNVSVDAGIANIYGDPDNIAAAASQLVLNAYEASSANGSLANAPVNINLSLTSDGKNITISVTNSGTLPEKYTCEQLAEAFFSTKDNHAGCGLYIANIVCSTHNGWLTIECGESTTTVSMTLSASPEQK